ncbi:MAG TPA: alpha/beta fold hydrolase [Thermoanaerobaculia bacterium]
MARYAAGVDGVVFESQGERLLGAFYRGGGLGPRPTAVLLHGLPGVEKHLDVAYRLRDCGWNCLAFHPRGSWGSGGSYTLEGQVDDTRAALAWARAQPAVAAERLALVGGSKGGYTVLRSAAADLQLAAVVALCPVVVPHDFAFSPELAAEFAGMLHGVSGAELLAQWSGLQPLSRHLAGLRARPLLLVTGDRDELFPPAHYTAFAAALPRLDWRRHPEGDHAFSLCRGWLVDQVTDWLAARLGA